MGAAASGGWAWSAWSSAGCVFGAAVAAVATADLCWPRSPRARSSSRATAASKPKPSAPISGSAPGERLDSYKIDQALKALYATGLFQDVRINQSGGRLIVTVVENPVINRVAFEGNKKLKDEQLANEVQSKARGTLSRPTVQADVQRIVEIYRRNGRFDVRVEPKIIELPNNRVDLVFEINEGDKTGVKKIIFVGNNAYRDQRLKDEIKTSETYSADRIPADGRHLRSRPHRGRPRPAPPLLSQARLCRRARRLGGVGLRSGAEGLHRHLHDRRRRRATGSARSTSSRTSPWSTRIRFTAACGPRPATSTTPRRSKSRSRTCRSKWPAAAIRSPSCGRAATATWQPRTINVAFIVEDGPRVYIERINIRGNTRTRDYVIRREFDIGEGDAYNRALIDRAERRLKNLNYFKTVKITNEPGSAPDRIVLNVDVEEHADRRVLDRRRLFDRRRLHGRGQRRRAQPARPGPVSPGVACNTASAPAASSCRSPSRISWAIALGVGIDLYAKQTLASNYISYDSETVGAATARRVSR